MQTIKYPDFGQEAQLLSRPGQKLQEQRERVMNMLQALKDEGGTALRRFALQFDGVLPEPLFLDESALEKCAAKVDSTLRQAIEQAYNNIRRFHAVQAMDEPIVETQPGVLCWRISVPIERVGLYIPGGTAPLFSTVLMLGVPAQLAGCRELVLCTPPSPQGEVHPAICLAALLCGIKRIYRVGGVQAIGAMAYGIDPIPQVWKIFGPGNSWVTIAKQCVSQEGVAIDLPAGPSEIAILADESAIAAFTAADLLSQAEHGPDSQVLLVSTSAKLLEDVEQELAQQTQSLPRAQTAISALDNSRFLLVRDLEEGMEWINRYAPEHLLLQVENPNSLLPLVRNAGSVFLGHYSPESAGDYASGTNHTLPTGGHARAWSGLSVEGFMKKISIQQIDRSGLSLLAQSIVPMAQAEQLDAHALAVTIRLKDDN